jgi:Spy/CpxP family protein refolding chaperone
VITPNPIQKMKSFFALALVAPLVPAAQAASSPYAGEQTREIKALSAEEIAGYNAGRGMGLARPAELNGYPGPRHVLDAAGELQLTPAQVSAINGIFDAMKSAAIPLGEKLVLKETELDRLFTSRQATEAAVRQLTGRIGRLQGELRAVHLSAHLATVKILNGAQIEAYNHLRGYDVTAPAGQTHHHGNHGSP